tara:strand:+ start:193 stop:387 length:195 start_codon:yes stop_codon:yes gene_type:complete
MELIFETLEAKVNVVINPHNTLDDTVLEIFNALYLQFGYDKRSDFLQKVIDALESHDLFIDRDL